MAQHTCMERDAVDALLAARNTRITDAIIKDADDVWVTRPVLEVEQIETGRGKAKATRFIHNYCPFCGASYRAEKTDGTEAPE